LIKCGPEIGNRRALQAGGSIMWSRGWGGQILPRSPHSSIAEMLSIWKWLQRTTPTSTTP
jgi:hypothetical protein